MGRYKKDNEYYDGKSIVYNGKRYISPSEAILLEAGYEKEEPQVVVSEPYEPTAEERIAALREQLNALSDEMNSLREQINEMEALE